MLREAKTEPKNRHYLTCYGDYRERSLRSLSKKEFAFIIKALLYDARPEEDV